MKNRTWLTPIIAVQLALVGLVHADQNFTGNVNVFGNITSGGNIVSGGNVAVTQGLKIGYMVNNETTGQEDSNLAATISYFGVHNCEGDSDGYFENYQPASWPSWKWTYEGGTAMELFSGSLYVLDSNGSYIGLGPGSIDFSDGNRIISSTTQGLVVYGPGITLNGGNITTTSGNGLNFTAGAANKNITFGTPAGTGDIIWSTNGIERMRLKSDGKLGVGVSDPSATVTILDGGNGSNPQGLLIRASQWYDPGRAYVRIFCGDNEGFIRFSRSNGGSFGGFQMYTGISTPGSTGATPSVEDWSFGQGSGDHREAFTIRSSPRTDPGFETGIVYNYDRRWVFTKSGNFGVNFEGGIDPRAIKDFIHIGRNNGGITFMQNGTEAVGGLGARIWQDNTNKLLVRSALNGIQFTNNAGSVTATIESSGNVGIGQPNPTARLHVGGNVKVNGAVLIPPQGDLSMGNFTAGPQP